MKSVLSFPLTVLSGLAVGALLAIALPTDMKSAISIAAQNTMNASLGVTSAAPVEPTEPELPGTSEIEACDVLAAHPNDPGRFAPGVADGDMAVGLAIRDCMAAVTAAPGEARAHFQLGRALWLSGRYDEAFASFVEASTMGYGAAHKFIGDAYLEGKGLPPGEVQSAESALLWYGEAQSAGYVQAANDVREVEDYIRQNTFNRSIFKRGYYMKKLFDGDLAGISDGPEFFGYAQGVFQMLNSDQAMDHAPECKPLLSKMGEIRLKLGHMATVFAPALKQEELGDKLFGIIGGAIDSGLALDDGNRDAVTLFQHYGCDSEIARRIIGNLVHVDTLAGR